MLGNLDTDLVASSNISLGSLVKPSIKSAIWANKYVDLSLLLAPDQPDLEVDNAPQLRWTQKKAMSIKHIQQWTDAFQMFISIYCLRFPTEASNLMKYMATVRNIAKKKGYWAQYDVKFLKLRELQPSLGWEVVHSELYHEARLEFVLLLDRRMLITSEVVHVSVMMGSPMTIISIIPRHPGLTLLSPIYGTPNILKRMLNEAGYDFTKTQFLFDRFSQGFRLNCSCSPSTMLHIIYSQLNHIPGW